MSRNPWLTMCNAFDFDTLTDVVLHLKYTARERGEVLGRAATKSTSDALADDNTVLTRLFSAKHEFPSEWYRFLHPADSAATSTTLQVDLARERFPFQLRSKPITLSKVTLFLKPKVDADAAKLNLNLEVGQTVVGNAGPPGQLANVKFSNTGSPFGKLLTCEPMLDVGEIPLALVLKAENSELAILTKGKVIEDLWIVCDYSVKSPKP